MTTRGFWVAAAALTGLMLSSPAWATGYGHGGWYGGGHHGGHHGGGYGGGHGFMCGGKDKNGCSVSPVTYKSCSKDLKGDIRELKCDILELISDIRRGRTNDIPGDIKEIKQDLAEIQFDLNVLKGLSKNKKH